jgi:Cytochrome C oxidase, cbb3-type, subunit III
LFRNTKWLHACVGVAGLLLATGCRQDMHDQPKFIPLRESDFFADHRSVRPLVDGTVARGDVEGDGLLDTGKLDGQDATVFPFPVTWEVMARGQERFDIFCSPCHGRTANGDGMVVRRGFRAPPSLHVDRLRQASLGHFFDVITNGFGAMPDYRDQVPVRDRWAIIAYIRALQASTAANVADVPAEKRGELRPPAK